MTFDGTHDKKGLDHLAEAEAAWVARDAMEQRLVDALTEKAAALDALQERDEEIARLRDDWERAASSRDQHAVALVACASDRDRLRDQLGEAREAIKHRHRRGENESFVRFGCICGLSFRRPEERDEHVYKANEATWESLEARCLASTEGAFPEQAFGYTEDDKK